MPLVKYVVCLLFSALIAQTTPAPSPTDREAIPSTKPDLAGPEDSGIPCADYSQCGIKGKFYWNQLVSSIQNPVPDVDRTQIFDEFYATSWESSETMQGAEISDELVKHGLSYCQPIEDYGNWYAYARLDDGEFDPEYNPYRNLISTKDGVIIAYYNYRKEDAQQKLQWSDIIYESYQGALRYEDQPGQSIKDLQTVIRYSVANSGTIAMAKTAYAAQNLQWYDNGVWQKWTLKDTPYLFYGFLGTDNIKGITFLLKDHAQEIGNKVITEIWTRNDPQFDIWINLGPL
ncbi:MAG: hypothetical protein Q9220_004032 [cf. Caloplaca sp. 1 TL-2023]